MASVFEAAPLITKEESAEPAELVEKKSVFEKQDSTMMPIEKTKRSRATLCPLISFRALSCCPSPHLDLGLGVVRGEGRAERRADRADAAGADDAAGDARGRRVGGRRRRSG